MAQEQELNFELIPALVENSKFVDSTSPLVYRATYSILTDTLYHRCINLD